MPRDHRRRFRLLHREPPPPEAESRSIVPTAGHAIEGDAVLAGKLLAAEGKGWVFALRLGGDGRVRHGTAWLCAERVVAEPRTVVPSVDGGITIVGESSGPGFVARVRKDGTLGFVQFPHKGLGVPDVLALSSVAELPVTGMVVALRSENFPLEDFPCDVETRAFAPTLTEVEGIALPIPLNRG